ncbi:hypothetical protein LMJF_20_0190 [Leishmania major strain Friedlin]|uniref:Uncharacterized protein n=1 Tax=Leishmania major TaxID=5664 RepID=Q4QD25_LEIMA|nr:hypothetical protein LMJF_20_0190 [Leishmania major strain Friedlin]CAG9573090.1 hypothetical_protein_-_conserved [Leishmania major strain Friedlin]CAJ03580.1 hypothetical protein LMJF_20_0190 [Leishmania major strain Friedlin]|eukprot:XP_001682773.1 hypothetical protein LMJF_20_0190 [Leishmania major strain Friedlin]
MRRKRSSYVTCTVNGNACQSDDGMYDVKTLYGPHTVLLRALTTVPSSSLLSSAPSPAEASRRRSEPLASFTICAVDARGRFVVKQSGTYEVGAIGAVEEQAEAGATARAEVQAAIHDVQRVPEAAPKTAGERQSAMKEVRRAPNKYSMFLSKFSKVFSKKGFQAAAAEWRRFSAESKRSEEVDALIARVVRSGRYPMRQPKS